MTQPTSDIRQLMGLEDGLLKVQHADLTTRIAVMTHRPHAFRPGDPIGFKEGLYLCPAAAADKTGFAFLRYLRWWSAADRRIRRQQMAINLPLHCHSQPDCIVVYKDAEGSGIFGTCVDSRMLEPFHFSHVGRANAGKITR